LHDSPALARLVKRSPNELLCGTYCFILFYLFTVISLVDAKEGFFPFRSRFEKVFKFNLPIG